MEDTSPIDVTDWKLDVEHGYFPIGARDKRMLWSPDEPPAGIKPNWPYLFKSSRKSYPDQYWMEVVAYLVGQAMGLDVPKAAPAISNDSPGETTAGSLLEWFYDPSEDNFVHARDFFSRINPSFDNDKGTQHNLYDLLLICRALTGQITLRNSWKEWLTDLFLYDALIGNTDRHQENWGVIFTMDEGASLSPFYDNGTSLGHERFPERVAGWSEKQIHTYISKGCHHLRFKRDEPRVRISHLQSIELLVGAYEGSKNQIKKRFDFDFDVLATKIRMLCSIETVVPFSEERAEWVIRLLRVRYDLLTQQVQ